MKLQQNFTQFEIDAQRGFLPPDDPLTKLPAQYGAWDELGNNLPKHLISDTVKSTVDALKPLDISGLKTKAELERAMMVLSFVGHAYVWGQSTPPSSIPQGLAIPWYQISEKLGRPPILSYASYALHNWSRIDPKGPIALGNIALIQNFFAGADEEWFILVHVDIENKAARAVTRLLDLEADAIATKFDNVEIHLTEIDAALDSIFGSLDRMPEFCDPYIYYNRVRPYIHGWKNHPALPQGMLYDGVAAYQNKPQQFRGETGSQSSIIPALDAALRITHKDDPLRAYLDEMREYMPPRHRAFLEALESGPSLRDILSEKNKVPQKVRDLYNKCVEWIAKFRTLHLEYAVRYIESQNQSSPNNPTKVGTGGTPFVPYLKKHRDETSDQTIK